MLNRRLRSTTKAGRTVGKTAASDNPIKVTVFILDGDTREPYDPEKHKL